MKKFIVLFAVMFIMLTSAQIVFAQSPPPTPIPAPSPGPTPPDPDAIYTLPEFLNVLTGPLGWLGLGMLVSLILRKIEWYNEQTGEIKRLLQVVITATLSIVAWSLITFVPVDVLVALTPVFTILAGVTLTWASSEITYLIFVRPTLSK